MTFEEYQTVSRETAIYPNIGSNYIYPVLGLAGETGEVAEKVKKLIRDKKGEVDEEFRQLLDKELGDVLWFLAQIASEFGLKLEDIASNNIIKLKDRKERGVLQGSGDLR